MPRTEGGNAPVRRHARAPTRRRRTTAGRRRTTALPRSPRVSTACVSPARTSRTLLDRRAHASRSVRALAAAPSVPRHARTPRVVVPRALTRRSRHCKALRSASVLGYKRPPSSSPAREPPPANPPSPPPPVSSQLRSLPPPAKPS
jgi:hypothetical protein